jgi:hypothetical protein
VPALGSLARFVSVVASAAVLFGFELSLGVQAWTRGCLALGLALSARLAVTTSSWLLFCAAGRVCFACAFDLVWVCRRHMDSSTRHLCRLRSLEGPLRDLEGARLFLWPRCYSGAGWRVVLHPVASRYCDGYFVILSSFGATRFGPIAVLRIGIAASGARCAPRRLFARCSWASVSVACSTVRLGFRCGLEQGRLVASSRAGGGATPR